MWQSVEKLHIECMNRRDRLARSRRNTRIAVFGVLAAFGAVIAVVLGIHPR